MGERKAWLDIALIECPNCGHYYSDASWYVVEIGADIECGKCHTTFNTKKHVKDRVILEFSIDRKDTLTDSKISKHF